MKILIVDDSETMRMIIVKSLRQAGFDTVDIAEAGTARDGLAVIAKGGINLVLSDVNMPEISGIEMVKVIRSKFPTLPIVMVTTESSPEMKQKMLAAGASGIIHKPFPPEQLKEVLGPFIKGR